MHSFLILPFPASDANMPLCRYSHPRIHSSASWCSHGAVALLKLLHPHLFKSLLKMSFWSPPGAIPFSTQPVHSPDGLSPRTFSHSTNRETVPRLPPGGKKAKKESTLTLKLCSLKQGNLNICPQNAYRDIEKRSTHICTRTRTHTQRNVPITKTWINNFSTNRTLSLC